MDLDRPELNAEQVEKVIRKVRSGMMPPAGAPRPDAARLKAFAAGLETRIDQAAATEPHIGAPDLHRVNRTEYRNSVRDLIGIDVNVTELLPPDSRSGAFDNMADALTVTPTLMQAYTRAADRISREAVGDLGVSPGMSAYNVQRVANQMRHVEGTPFGTRGEVSRCLHTFPADGDYIFRVDLHHWFTGNIIGSRLPEPLRDQDIEISIDGQRTVLLAIDPLMKEEDGPIVSDPIHVEAGQHRVAVAFLTKFDGPIQDQYRLIEHTLASTDIANHPQMTALPHLKTVSITGPFDVSGLAESNARQQIFTCRPAATEDETTCAREIISRLARQAFRRPVVDIDVDRLMVPYDAGREGGDFETGIRTALQAILADPEFVFRFERVPRNVQPGASFRLSDLELASRLSFFLWSSPPDDELLRGCSQRRARGSNRTARASRTHAGQIHAPRRWRQTLPDSGCACRAFRTWFRNRRSFRRYSTSLGASMRREVELFFASIMREDRDVLDLLTADYTYVDEVLARHYGLPVQQGPRFRRVEFERLEPVWSAREGRHTDDDFAGEQDVTGGTGQIRSGGADRNTTTEPLQPPCRHSRKRSKTKSQCRFESGCPNTATILSVAPVTRSWTRSDWLWRTSMLSACGGSTTAESRIDASGAMFDGDGIGRPGQRPSGDPRPVRSICR